MKKTLIFVIIALVAGGLIGYFYNEYQNRSQLEKTTAANSGLDNCLSQVDKNDPLGLFDKDPAKEAKRQDCFTKYPPKDKNNPLGI